MADYISREDLRTALYEADAITMKGVGILNQFPSADVVEVVRCGDCKHWFDNGSDYCSCDRDALLRDRNFFCASGERESEE